MIRLTRLNGQAFLLNAELIRYVETLPDTFVTLTGGERVVVAETMDDVLQRVIEYQQTKNLIPVGGRPARAPRTETGAPLDVPAADTRRSPTGAS